MSSKVSHTVTVQKSIH